MNKRGRRELFARNLSEKKITSKQLRPPENFTSFKAWVLIFSWLVLTWTNKIGLDPETLWGSDNSRLLLGLFMYMVYPFIPIYISLLNFELLKGQTVKLQSVKQYKIYCTPFSKWFSTKNVNLKIKLTRPFSKGVAHLH